MERDIFEKELSHTDINTRLAVPTESLTDFEIPEGQYGREFNANDINGDVWPFRIVIRRSGHPKPELASGTWTRYVQAKKLRVGDRVRLVMVGGGADGQHFRIHAERKIRLLGQNIWADVEKDN